MTFEVDLFVRNKDLLDGVIFFITKNWESLFGNGKGDYYLGLAFLQAYFYFLDHSLL